MKTGIKKITLLISLLVLFVFLAGCSEDTSSSNATTPATVSTTGPSSTAPYSAGDVIQNPQDPAQTALLIISYNSSTDKYERAFIYPNADGSWGYRVNMNTEKVSRVLTDRIYTQKVATVTPSLVPVRTHVTTATPTSTTTSTTTTIVSPTGKPTFKKIVPDEGTAGKKITITSLTGTNFRSGATVTLKKDDNPNITATDVSVESSTLLTCTFNPPANSTPGAWDVVITNPNGQYVIYSYIFTIHTPVETTTTSSEDSEGITSVSPTFTIGNDVVMTIIGSGFQSGNLKIQMTKSAGTVKLITARNTRWDSETKVTAWFTIPEGSKGTWTVVVINPDGTRSTLTNGFEVKA
ncbi:MAG: hypothetical protein M0Q91_11115 [Methanoregula sp.]|jgi:hypothetical protein|nr:hypothetical protein [Methanoregula sp.]